MKRKKRQEGTPSFGKPSGNKPSKRGGRSSEPTRKSAGSPGTTRSGTARTKSTVQGAPRMENLETKMLKYFRGFPGKEFTRNTVIKKFQLKHDREEILVALEKLLKSGFLENTVENKFILTGKKPEREIRSGGGPVNVRGGEVVEGIIDITRHGFGFVRVEGREQDVFIPQPHLNRALNKDTVKAVITGVRNNGKTEGRVVEIVKHNQIQFVGTLEISDNFAFVVTDQENMPYDIFVSKEDIGTAKDREKVIVTITEWPERSKNPHGKVIESLGKAGTNDIEMKSILIENGFNLHFPDAVMTEMDRIADVIDEKEIVNRRDMRGVPTFTIDPDDAKDFDDALSIQKLDNGLWEIGVHIADVSHYVKPGTALDAEAYDRSTSVYLVDRVLPMFPERLSNIICSLRPNEDKLTFSTIFSMNEEGEVAEVWYGKTIIHSDRRFTYRQAQDGIETGEGDYAQELQLMNRIALKLRAERTKKGSIPFDSKEVRFKLDENSKPIGIYVKEMLDSNRLIEDYMLLANKYVATYISKLHVGKNPIPNVYRVHDVPDMTRLENFGEFARKFGYVLTFEDPKQIAGTLNDLLKKIKGRPEQDVLEQLAIRSMAKAIYTTNNIGHYGLAFEYYSHFTSPIRRFPDVLTHRILQEILSKNNNFYPKAELEEMCVYMSQQERAAMIAERESVKYKQVEYMSDKIGQEFEGIITGVIQKGIFVEIIENKCEGFIEQNILAEFPMEYDEAQLSLRDRDTDTTFQLGEKLMVRVVKTDLERRTIDFELVR